MSMVEKGRVPRAQRREWFGFSSVKKQKTRPSTRKFRKREARDGARAEWYNRGAVQATRFKMEAKKV